MVRVSLVTEGSYPNFHGGVSVWCDQLVRGLTEHEFEIVSITATGSEIPVWQVPENVAAVRSIPLWGPQRRPPARRGALRERLRPRSPKSGRGPAGWSLSDELVNDVVLRFGDAIVEPDMARARRGFRYALESWVRIAPYCDIESAVLSRRFVGHLMDRLTQDLDQRPWDGSPGSTPTVGDVVTASRLITHAMRPLSAPAPDGDIVHLVANGIAGLPGIAAKWLHGTPYVLSEHGVYLRERYLSFGRSGYSFPLKWLMLRFYRLLTSVVYEEAALVAPGNVYNRRWETQDGVAPEAIRTVYNGVDPDEFGVEGGEPAVPTIAFVGRVDPIKDLATLLRAFAMVTTAIPNARLRIFGGTPGGNEEYAASLKSLAGTLGISGSVTFEGRVEVIQDAYAAGHVVALTSISEGFPYSVIEAMSCGRATVSTDVGGVAEAVGSAGLVVPPSSPEAFAAACIRLLRDHTERRFLAEAARSRVIELFTLERSLNAFRAIYADVLADNVEVATIARGITMPSAFTEPHVPMARRGSAA